MVVKTFWFGKKVLDESKGLQSLMGKVVFTFFSIEVFIKHLVVLIEAFSIWKKRCGVFPAHATKVGKDSSYSAKTRIKENSVQREDV